MFGLVAFVLGFLTLASSEANDLVFDMPTSAEEWTGRYLQSSSTWEGIRIQVFYNDTDVAETDLTELKTILVPTVVRWYGRVLSIPRLTSPLKLPRSWCGRAFVPADHRTTGVASADLVVYIVTVNRLYTDTAKTTWMTEYTEGYPCVANSVAPKRPLAGFIKIVKEDFATMNKLGVVARAFAQILGFNPLLFPIFNKPDGTIYLMEEMFKRTVLAGLEVTVMTLPTVIVKARSAFACDTLPGVRMSTDSSSKLWNAKMMLGDFMSELSTNPSAESVSYSDISLAVLQDSGWYQVQWEYTDRVAYGFKRGCSFFTAPCIASGQASFYEFCTAASNKCSPTLQRKGTCDRTIYSSTIPTPFQYLGTTTGGNSKMDYCPIGNNGSSCLTGTVTAGEEACPTCRCFEGNYAPNSGAWTVSNTHCHRVDCYSGKAFVTVGSQTVECPAAGGAITLTGFTGQFTCPPAASLCAAASCPNLCSGYGKCVGGVCVCESGRSPPDCSITCNISCATCTGTAANQCSSCRMGATLSSGTCTCGAGMTINASGQCTAAVTCDISCATCSGTTAVQCTSCQSSAILTAGGECKCAVGKTMNTSGNCVDCAINCKECQISDINVCTACYGTLALQGSAPYCSCSAGTYLTDGLCKACSAECATCSGSSTTCLTCPTGLTSSGSTCVCPNGKYFISTSSSCGTCHTSCVTCIGATQNDCLSCASGTVTAGLPGRCLCWNGLTAKCSACDRACLTCVSGNPFACLTCGPNSTLNTNSGLCVCNVGYYPNPDAMSCSVCHTTCKTCNGSSSKSCLSCPALANFYSGECQCAYSTYRNLSTQQCTACPTKCGYCNPTTGACLSCMYGTSFNSAKVCVLSDGYYVDEVRKISTNCPSNCKTCSSTDLVNLNLVCSACMYGMTLDATTKVCNCPQGTYFDSNLSMCDTCDDSNCLICPAPLTCTQCISPFLVKGGIECVCPAGFFKNGTSCNACHPNCVTCSGAAATNCRSCPTYSTLAPLPEGSCRCTGTSTNCVTCSPDCLTCDPADATKCLTCGASATLNSNNCVCNAGFAPSPHASTCLACSVNCGTCTSTRASDCITCFNGSTPPTSGCPCPDAYFMKDGTCQLCHTSCKTCSGSGFAQCLSCYASGALNRSTCPCSPSILVGTQCRKCPATCLDCNTTGGCQSCYTSAYIPATTQGVCSCLLGYYPNPDVINCAKCHPTCMNCSGPAANQCTACGSWSQLTSSHTCQCVRQSRFFPSSYSCSTYSFLCTNDQCSECTDPHATINSYYTCASADCSTLWPVKDCSCYQSYFTFPTQQINEMWSTGKCYECNPLCSYCSSDTGLCTGCQSDAKFTPISTILNTYGTCACNQGFYFSAEDSACLRCSKGCTVCTSQTSCSQCLSGYYLATSGSTSSCTCKMSSCTACPVGMYLLRPVNSCEFFCPTGFEAKDAECKETSSTKFVFPFSSISLTTPDKTKSYALSSTTTCIPLYQRGIWCPLYENAIQSLTPIGTKPEFVFAPTHYVEFWVKTQSFSLSRYSLSSDSTTQNNGNYPSFNYGRQYFSLTFVNALGNDDSKSASLPQPTVQTAPKWQLVRFELIAEQFKALSIKSRLRISIDNTLLTETFVLERYYRDVPYAGLKNSFSLYFDTLDVFSYSLGIQTTSSAPNWQGGMIAELTIANKLYLAELTTPCGCPVCSNSGMCLSSCEGGQYIAKDNSCQECSSTCPNGCVRGGDCIKNLDLLCNSFSEYKNCTQCKPQSAYNNGVCSCIPHATFLTSNNTCACEPLYRISDTGSCVLCQNYIEEHEADAEIDDDFLSLQVVFKTPMKVDREDTSCTSYFLPSTLAKLGSKPVCSWTPNRKQLTVSFGRESTLVSEDVELNGEMLIRSTGTCSYTAPKLVEKSKYKADLPKPEPAISGPNSVSLECGSTSSITLSALSTKGGKGRTLYYKWGFTHSSSGALFPQYNQFDPNATIIYLPTNSLSSGTLTVLLTVRNEFGQEASKQSVINLKGGRSLLVEMDRSGALNITSQDSVQLKANIRDTCGQTGDRVFTWTYIGANATLPSSALDPTTVLTVSKLPNTLVIPKGSLTPGFIYKYQVSVQQDGVIGSALLSVTVLRSQLLTRLNTLGGQQPNDLTLRVDASESSDPDNSAEPLAFRWICFENSATTCKDSAGGELLSSVSITSDNLAIAPDKLRLDAVYNFTVTVTKDKRSASNSVSFTIVKPTGISIVLKPISFSVLKQYYVSISPYIKTDLQTDFYWKQTAGPSSAPATPMTYPFLGFAENTLEAGQSYAFELAAKTIKGTIYGVMSFSVVRPPVGGKAGVRPTTGKALTDLFLMYTEGWEDPSSYYPLTYQFWASKPGSRLVPLSSQQLQEWVSSKLFKGSLTVTVKVYNNHGAVSESSTDLTVAGLLGRELVDATLMASFTADVQNQDSTFAMVTAYSDSVVFDQTFFSLVMSTLSSYVSSLYEVNSITLDAFLGTVETLATQNITKSVTNAGSVLSLVKTFVARSSSGLTQSDLQRIISLSALLSSDTSQNDANTLTGNVLAQYSSAQLPDQPAFSYSATNMASLVRRATGSTLNSWNYTSGNVTVTSDSGWLNTTIITDSDVVDVYLTAYKSNSSFSWVVALSYVKVGTYSSYNFNKAASTPLILNSLSSPLNVTIPFVNSTAPASLECVGLDNAGQWSAALCSILELKQYVAVVQTKSVTTLMLREKMIASTNPPNTIIPSTEIGQGFGCSLNPTPLSVAGLILVLMLVNFAFAFAKKEPTAPTTVQVADQQSMQEVSGEWIGKPETQGDSLFTKVNQINVTDDSVVKMETEVAVKQTAPEPTTSIWRKHLFLSIFTKEDLRRVNGGLLSFTIIILALALGLCYRFWADVTENEDNPAAVFTSYSQNDLIYVAVSIGFSNVFVSAIQFLAWKMPALSKIVMMVLMAAGGFAYGGVVYLNTEVCFRAGGLWAEGILWAGLLQIVVVETLKMAGIWGVSKIITRS